LRLIVSRVGNFDSDDYQDLLIVSQIKFFEALPYIVEKTNVLEQRIADLVYKLYGVTNLEDAPP
jgi:hypothetical protein